jgi:hypothetical protein
MASERAALRLAVRPPQVAREMVIHWIPALAVEGFLKRRT